MVSFSQQPAKNNMLIILSVVAIVAGLILLFLQIRGTNALKVSVEDERFALIQAQTALQQRLEYQANASLYREKAAKYLTMMPDQPLEEEILRSLGLIADEYKLNVQEIRFDARLPNEESGFVQMPVVIIVEGRYFSLIQMLDHLQWGGRAYRIDQIHISLADIAQGGIRAVIEANVFYRIGNFNWNDSSQSEEL